MKEFLLTGLLRCEEVGVCTIAHTSLSLRFALYTERQYLVGVWL